MKPMSDLDEGTLRRIDWQELFPITLLFRALTLACRPLPILAGTVLLSGGFFIGALAVPNGMRPLSACWELDGNWNFSENLQRTGHEFLENRDGPRLVLWIALGMVGLFFALAMARSGAVRLTSTERSGVVASIKFALRHYPSLLLAMVLPFLGTFAALLPLWLLRWCGDSVFYVLSPVEILLGLVATFFGLGGLLALPLMIGGIATDRCDGFDAFSRAFSYLVQRPFHYLFYVILLSVLALVGFGVVRIFTETASVILFLAVGGRDGLASSGLSLWGSGWDALLTLAPLGFLFVFKYTGFTAIYLMLRRSVDGVAFDVRMRDTSATVRRLTPILADELGAPVMADETGDGA